MLVSSQGTLVSCKSVSVVCIESEINKSELAYFSIHCKPHSLYTLVPISLISEMDVTVTSTSSDTQCFYY